LLIDKTIGDRLAVGLGPTASDSFGENLGCAKPMNLWRNEEGQDLLEYALVIALLVLVTAAAFPPLVTELGTAFNNSSACLNSMTGC
jgi:Flp pilus assembly pilin Flp